MDGHDAVKTAGGLLNGLPNGVHGEGRPAAFKMPAQDGEAHTQQRSASSENGSDGLSESAFMAALEMLGRALRHEKYRMQFMQEIQTVFGRKTVERGPEIDRKGKKREEAPKFHDPKGKSREESPSFHEPKGKGRDEAPYEPKGENNEQRTRTHDPQGKSRQGNPDTQDPQAKASGQVPNTHNPEGRNRVKAVPSRPPTLSNRRFPSDRIDLYQRSRLFRPRRLYLGTRQDVPLHVITRHRYLRPHVTLHNFLNKAQNVAVYDYDRVTADQGHVWTR